MIVCTGAVSLIMVLLYTRFAVVARRIAKFSVSPLTFRAGSRVPHAYTFNCFLGDCGSDRSSTEAARFRSLF